MANLVILKCGIKQNLKKYLTYFLKDRRRKFLRYRINSNWKSLPLCPIKWQPLNIFAKLHKSPLLIANIVKRAVSGLRQFQDTESPWKIMKKTYFILTNWIYYWQIRFCTYYVFLFNQMSDILEVWNYWPLKDGFWSIS